MSSQGVLIVARFFPKDNDSEKELLSFLREAGESAFKNEPGTTKYAFATNRNDTDTSIYVIEQYADQTALGHHVQQPHVQQLVEWLQSGGAGEPQISFFDILEGFEFVRPELTALTDPLLVFTDIEYKPNTIATVKPYWKRVFEKTLEDEKGALHWQLAQDPQNPDKVIVAHTYESLDYLMTVHATGKELTELQAFVKDIQVEIKPVLLKVQGGYLFK